MMTPTKNPQTTQWQALDSAHFFHPFTDHTALAKKGSRVIVKADNVYIWDSEGNKIMDGMSGLWCVNVGYGQKTIADAAFKQMNTLPYYNSFFQTTNPPAVELAKLLIDVAPKQPNAYTHVFFTGSGSEGNDTVLRTIRRYWDIKGEKQRKTVISRWNAYHGSTVAGASLGGMKFMHEHGDLPIPGIYHIDQPYHYENARLPGGGFEDKAAFGLRIAQQLEAKIVELGAHTVAAFIGEPIQGAGGVIIPPDSYWPEIQRICRKYDILLCSDEVICGFGRTGAWWGCETMGYEPDMITFAKGVTSGYIPLGGVLMTDKVAKVIHEGGELGHGYTYSGHPVACAVGLENVALIRDHKMVETVRDITGPRLKAGFELLAAHPLVGLAETRGLMGGLVLVKNKSTHEMFASDLGVGMVCRGHCFDNGLVMRAVGDRMIIAPPLVMTVAQIDELLAAITLCLDKTLADITARGWMA